MKVLASTVEAIRCNSPIRDVGTTEPGEPDFRFGSGKDDGTFTLFDGKRVRHQEQTSISDYDQAARMCFKWFAEGGEADLGIPPFT